MNKKALSLALLLIAFAFIAVVLLPVATERFGLSVASGEAAGIPLKIIQDLLILSAIIVLKYLKQKSDTRKIYTWLSVTFAVSIAIEYFFMLWPGLIHELFGLNPGIEYFVFAVGDFLLICLPIPFLLMILAKESAKDNPMALGHLLQKSILFTGNLAIRLGVFSNLFNKLNFSINTHSVLRVIIILMYILWALGAINIALKAHKEYKMEKVKA